MAHRTRVNELVNNRRIAGDESDEPSRSAAVSSTTKWQPGQSGNPRGRPPGRGNRSHAGLLAAVREGAEAVVRRVLQEAANGDMRAAKLVLDRVLPARVCQPVPSFQLPTIASLADANLALGAIAGAAMRGELTIEEASGLVQLVDGFRRMIETTELEARVAEVEKHLSQESGMSS
jgi:hypothetical protein